MAIKALDAYPKCLCLAQDAINKELYRLFNGYSCYIKKIVALVGTRLQFEPVEISINASPIQCQFNPLHFYTFFRTMHRLQGIYLTALAWRKRWKARKIGTLVVLLCLCSAIGMSPGE
jgi:hypothetical protein